MVAVKALEQLRKNPNDAQAKATFEEHKKDLGFGLLTKKYQPDTDKVTEAQIQQAANDSIPYSINSMFYAFRIMAGGVALLLIFGLSVYYSLRRVAAEKRLWLKLVLFAVPLPWIACEAVGLLPNTAVSLGPFGKSSRPTSPSPLCLSVRCGAL